MRRHFEKVIENPAYQEFLRGIFEKIQERRDNFWIGELKNIQETTLSFKKAILKQIKDLEIENNDLKKRNFKMDSEISQLKKYVEKFKVHVIEEHLNGNLSYKNESIENVLHLVNLREEDLKKEKLEQEKFETQKNLYERTSEDFEKEKSSKSINPFENLEGYMKSEVCACGNEKRYGSKGCKENCFKEMDKQKKRRGINNEEAWEEVWIDLGFESPPPMEEYQTFN